MNALHRCGSCQRLEERGRQSCTACGGPIVVVEDAAAIGALLRAELGARAERGLWRWFELLPVQRRANVVTLAEGGTPLHPGGALGEALDLPNLFIKNDCMMPTGSLKDRSSAVMVSKAKEDGYDTVVVASTGNGAASLAAYAAAAGLRCVVLVPKGTAKPKIAQALVYGAIVVEVASDMRGVAALYKGVAETFGWCGCLSENAYKTDGKKSYAYEIHEQLGGKVPDWIIHPTASGVGIVAMKNGYDDLVSLTWADRLPKLVVAQADAAAPLVAAHHGREAPPPGHPKSVAESILVPMLTPLAPRVLAALRETGGTAAAATDDEILSAQRLLARKLGLFVEPAAAVSIAIARQLRRAGTIGRDDVVVCNVTGTGLKQPEAAMSAADETFAVEPDLDAFRRALSGKVPMRA